ncbi:unnamed protein product [Linum tenue]|uniref:CCHC-type domain-containing protein n=1 Tax=Linum tenue TaxID=586396 RepID=A0AAV0IM71_9ROSI|nr:unnamed protein product [Linum tenue]
MLCMTSVSEAAPPEGTTPTGRPPDDPQPPDLTSPTPTTIIELEATPSAETSVNLMLIDESAGEANKVIDGTKIPTATSGETGGDKPAGLSMISLRALWRPTSAWEVHALDDDCFLVKLGSDQDYFKALTEGPWVIFDHYLLVQQWTPSFRVSDQLPKSMVVWVQFPGFPVHFYHKEILFSMGNMIGRAIKLDYHTLHQQRTKFARIAVEVDLSRPLVPRIRLDGKWQPVEYENVPVVCFECGRIGHAQTSCPSLRPTIPTINFPGAGGELSAGDKTDEREPNGGFGPWMVVARKSRRNQRASPNKGKAGVENTVGNGPDLGHLGKLENKSLNDLPSSDSQLRQPEPPKSQGKIAAREKASWARVLGLLWALLVPPLQPAKACFPF